MFNKAQRQRTCNINLYIQSYNNQALYKTVTCTYTYSQSLGSHSQHYDKTHKNRQRYSYTIENKKQNKSKQVFYYKIRNH